MPHAVLTHAQAQALDHDTGLCVRREDIAFYNVTPQRLRIEITVRNAAMTWSQPTPLHLESAPLGVFVPWRPLQTLTVPAIEPGGVVTVHTEVQHGPAPQPGQASGLPPGSRPNATDAGDFDEHTSARRSVETWAPVIGRLQRSDSTSLAPNVLELVERRNMHWVGNINVHIGQRSVERHMAKSLRVYPGRVNHAVFIVGCGPDAYNFELCGVPLREYVRIFEGGRRIRSLSGVDRRIEENHWHEYQHRMIVHVLLDLPRECNGGALDVHVLQRSTGKSAVVEFSLDAEAQGPGCFVV